MTTILRVMLVYLVVAAVSGGIAYLGNQLGRHVGRKKMSIFGMRPRHTSIFVTTVTGVMIALGTLTVAALLAKDVRQLLAGTEELERRQRELSEQVSRLTDTLESGNLIWGIDQAIFLGTLPPGIPAENIEDQLRNAVARANLGTILKYNEMARLKGKPGVPADEVLLSFEPRLLRELADRVRSSPEVFGLRVVAGRNYLLGDTEPLPVHFSLFPVKRVFRAGDVVASKMVDPHNPTFLMDWYQFLEEIKQTALKAGMMNGPDGGLGFELDSETMNALIQSIEREPGLARLEAVARKDLYQSSSLELKIVVRPAADNAARSGRMARVRVQ